MEKKKKSSKPAAKPHSGFVAILGRPNVGKSTLLNRLIGEKIAGVSPKPQTTRYQVRGILTRPEGQILYLDTPGLHKPQDVLGYRMNDHAQESLAGADLVYWMVLPEPPREEDARILELLRQSEVPAFLLVNQIDRYSKVEILPALDYYQQAFPFKEFFPISAKEGDQVEELISTTFKYLPENPPYYPEDQLSDQNERFITGEILREKLYHFTSQEIPYATAVKIESFKDRPDGLAHIQATIIVDKDSQKGIVIGKGGEMLKRIGRAARLEIEQFLGRKVFLELWVKVVPGWKKDKRFLQELEGE